MARPRAAPAGGGRLRLMLAATLLLGAMGCGGGLHYSPAELDHLSSIPRLVALPFDTPRGRQNAYYLPPASPCEGPPTPLVVVFPGIGSRALDWLDFALNSPVPQAGFLLLDYPGRGRSEGLLRPRDLPQTAHGALAALGRHLSCDAALLEKNLVFVAHSFGAAAALQFAQESPPRRLVLVAPFTTLHKALFHRFGPLAWLVPDAMDNRRWLKALVDGAPRPAVTIIHGDEDRRIPVAMGRELAAVAPLKIHFHEIPGGDHIAILQDQRPLIYTAVFAARIGTGEKHPDETGSIGTAP